MSETEAPARVEGGNYEVIRARLSALGDQLLNAANALNSAREAKFGSSGLKVLGNERVRTENNCVPVDIVAVGSRLLFGYNVFLGLKRETRVEDVLSLHRFERQDGAFAFHHASAEEASWLSHPQFVKEFADLVQYYKDARLIQLRVTDGKLLAVFQVGKTALDFKVLRWAVSPRGEVTWIDSRGERDHVFAPRYGFEWIRTTREQHVSGRHPHVNIEDVVFVETVGGDLTIKVENNTRSGEGIYAEPVLDPNQSLDDAEIRYARTGPLVLLAVKPYREEQTRYLVFNQQTRAVVRIDAIGHSCVLLPEDHGILFPGGYYLRTGEYKVFDTELTDLEFVRSLPSPNGEDVLFIFHRRRDGLYALYPYNLIRKEVATPLHAHGYSLFDDGILLVTRAEAEPTRVHPMQIWQTPFVSPEFYSAQPNDGSLLSRVGNKDLVRGISDALTLVRFIRNQSPNRAIYEELVASAVRFVDAYYWAAEAELGDLRSQVEAIRRTAELVIDEFVKVQELERRAAEVLAEARRVNAKLEGEHRAEGLRSIEAFLAAMTAWRRQRGHVITLKETRYVDRAALDALEKRAIDQFDAVSQAAVTFLLGGEAFAPLLERLEALGGQIEAAQKSLELPPLQEQLDQAAEGSALLAEVVSSLQVADPAQKTNLLDQIGTVLAAGNRVRAILVGRSKDLRAGEARAEFQAQIKLFGQAVQGAIGLCDTPEAAETQLARLGLQLEELEARFGEFDEFLPELAHRREEVHDTLNARRQQLLDERQKRRDNVFAAAERILTGVRRRATSFASEDELNTFYATDGMVLKLQQLGGQLAELGDQVRSEELASKVKSARQEALRGLRDKLELFEGGEDKVRFGKHSFTVTTQAPDLTLVVRQERLTLHLTGTDLYLPVEDPGAAAAQPYWSQALVSENDALYRAEYLAGEIVRLAEKGEAGLSPARLDDAVLSRERALELVREVASRRVEEGYDRGIHDADAALLLTALVPLRRTADLLRFGPRPRSLAALFWAFVKEKPSESWTSRARNLARLREAFGPSPAQGRLIEELASAIASFAEGQGFDPAQSWARAAAPAAGAYLFEVLARDPERFLFSAEAGALVQRLDRWLEDHGGSMRFEDTLRPIEARPELRFEVKRDWAAALAAARQLPGDPLEAAALWVTRRVLAQDVLSVDGQTVVEGLLGQHPRVRDRKLPVRLDDLETRLAHHREQVVPGFQAWRALRTELLERWRRRLRLSELQPRVMSAFVRNQLINEVYLPLVGDNLAKQIGAAGAAKRTDLMGLLLLVSPPGYGKTTLMEYVANRLGLIFVKVNGPALGHGVHSLDPAEAPNATARQEVEKINLALEMGNNVMLYLDDIQHTHPELLQKFISLCDATRRIEGVWDGRTRTYDLRGKKFAVVMAGNPYTETGEKFQIPDMLANRADTYNLGDILGGRQEAFALSFLENALTSNPVLAPLAARAQADVVKLVRAAAGEPLTPSELSHDYSAVELQEIQSVLRHLLRCRDVLLKVNAEYIRSAAMEDHFRTEPRFQLQGSYRNMNKMAEKVVAALTPAEVDALITDHYRGESQTLTGGAEFNLLRLAELRGTATPAEAARLAEIREEFRRLKLVGGGDDDPVGRLTGVLSGIAQSLTRVQQGQPEVPARLERLDARLATLADALQASAGGSAALSELAQAVERLGGSEGPVQRPLAVVAQALAQRPSLDLQPLVQVLERQGSAQSLGDVLHELRALRKQLEAGLAEPRRAMGESRVRLLSQAQRALAGEVRPVEAGNDPVLAAALSVVEMLTVHMSAAARARLPAEHHEPFLAELRRTVASAVADLAGRANDQAGG